MTPLVTGLATWKCHQKQRFKKLLGGWEKSKFLEGGGSWAEASSRRLCQPWMLTQGQSRETLGTNLW